MYKCMSKTVHWPGDFLQGGPRPFCSAPLIPWNQRASGVLGLIVCPVDVPLFTLKGKHELFFYQSSRTPV